MTNDQVPHDRVAHDLGVPLAVDVPGGTLACRSWGPDDGAVVVAVHGITANAVSWALVGQALAGREIRLVAPDLRGRGDSAGLGDASIGRHAEDVWAVLDSLGTERATLLGHSMGGFVVAVAATRRPERARAVVLVDGGPPLTADPVAEERVEEVLRAVVGPALARLDRTFPDRAAYRTLWEGHPGVAAGTPGWLLDAYATHDAGPVDGGTGVRCRVVREQVLADAHDTLVDTEVLRAVHRLSVPTRMLVAERGFTDGPDPLYPDAVVQQLRADNPFLDIVRVAGTNHYTITTSPVGAAAVADAVERAVTGGR